MSPKMITGYVQKLARAFRPERVVLFGSHARGTATSDSDVDLLVIMSHSGNSADQALAIRRQIPRSFPLDLMVKTPAEVRQRLHRKDSFLKAVMQEGEVVYERQRDGMARKSRR